MHEMHHSIGAHSAPYCRVYFDSVRWTQLGCHGQLACPCPPPRTGEQVASGTRCPFAQFRHRHSTMTDRPSL